MFAQPPAAWRLTLARLWLGLAILQVILGGLYWQRQWLLDVLRWSVPLETKRKELFRPYAAILAARRQIPPDAVVLLEDPTPDTEHFCSYFLYPRQITPAPSSFRPTPQWLAAEGITHVLRLQADQAIVRSLHTSGPK